MNWDQVKGNWKQFKGNVKEQWGKLTDDQLDIINGKRDQLAGKLQEAYGIGKEEAERQIAKFETRYAAWQPILEGQTAARTRPHRKETVMSKLKLNRLLQGSPSALRFRHWRLAPR